MGSKQSTENKNSATMPDFFNFEEDFFIYLKNIFSSKLYLHNYMKLLSAF